LKIIEDWKKAIDCGSLEGLRMPTSWSFDFKTWSIWIVQVSIKCNV
jgi:hypothetical protein